MQTRSRAGMTWDSNDLISVLKNEFHLVETHTEIWSIFFARGKYAGYSALTILTVIFYFIYLNCDLNLGDGQTAPSSLLPPTPLFLQPPPPLMYFFTCFIKQKTKTRHGFAFERIWWPYIGHSRGRNISFRKIFPSYHFL